MNTPYFPVINRVDLLWVVGLFGIQNFEAFLLASIALNLVPGSDTFYVLGRSLAQGRGVGIASALGVSGGALVHTLLAALGLSAVIVASPVAFFAIKMLGAAYLIFLGLKMLMHKSMAMEGVPMDSRAGGFSAFKQGLITNVMNPKVAMFFLAFLPQFISSDSQSHLLGFMILGLTFVATSTLWGAFLAWSSASMSQTLRDNPQYLKYLNRITGTLLVGLGIKLATSR